MIELRSYYLIEYSDGTTFMCESKAELAHVLDYAYSYINLIFRTEYFVFSKRKDILALKQYKNGKEVKNIRRSNGRGDRLHDR